MNLNCIHPNNQIYNTSIEVIYKMNSDSIDIEFIINPYNLNISNINRSFQLDNSSIGLWDYDVVEVFIANSDESNHNLNHYFEFNVSPLNQYFELEIFKPREKTNSHFKSNFIHKTALFENTWNTKINIPLNIFGKSNNLFNLYGNFCACLGSAENRTYWSSYLPVQSKPDFHLPQYFRKLS